MTSSQFLSHSDKVQKLLDENGKSFEPANAKRASEAAESLAVWVTANIQVCNAGVACS